MKELYRKWAIGSRELLENSLEDTEKKQELIHINYSAKEDGLLLATLLESLYDYFKVDSPGMLKVFGHMSITLTRTTLNTIAMFDSHLINHIQDVHDLFNQLEIEYTERESKAKGYLSAFRKVAHELSQDTKDKNKKEKFLFELALSLLYKLTEEFPILIEIKETKNISNENMAFIKACLNQKENFQLTFFSTTLELENKEFLKEAHIYLLRYDFLYFLEEQLIKPIKINDKLVGRIETIEILSNEAKHVHYSGSPFIRKISGNAGMGKTELMKYFSKHHLLKEQFIIETTFRNEIASYTNMLYEIKTFTDEVQMKMDPNINDKIKKVLMKSTKSIKSKAGEISSMFSNEETSDQLLSDNFSSFLGNLGVGKVKDIYDLIIDYQDSVLTIKDYLGTKQFNQPMTVFREKKNNKIEEVINDLLSNLDKVFSQNFSKKKSIVWFIDDIQWVDQFSLRFLNEFIKKMKSKSYPIYIVLLSRISDFEARINTEAGLLLLNEQVNQNINLSFFNERNIYEIGNILFENEEFEKTNLLANSICDYLQDSDGKVKVEPIYVIELLQVFINSDTPIIYLNQENKFIIPLELKDVRERIGLIIKNLRNLQSNKTVSNKTEAILEERLIKISRHIINGDIYNNMIKFAAYIGEPIIYTFVNYYMKNEFNEELCDKYIEQIEQVHQIIKRKNTSSPVKSSLMFNFTHAIYKEFLQRQFIRLSSDLTEGQLHREVFYKLQDYFLQTSVEDQEGEELEFLALKEQIIEHGIRARKEEILTPLLDIINILLNNYENLEKYNRASEVNELKLKLLENEDCTNPNMLFARIDQILFAGQMGNYKKAYDLAVLLETDLTIFIENYLELGEFSLIYQVVETIAEAYENYGQYEKAQDMYDVWIENSMVFGNEEEFLAEVYIRKGRIAVRQQDYKKATKYCDKALEYSIQTNIHELEIDAKLLQESIQNQQGIYVKEELSLDAFRDTPDSKLGYFSRKLSNEKRKIGVSEQERLQLVKEIKNELSDYDKLVKNRLTQLRFTTEINLADLYFQMAKDYTNDEYLFQAIDIGENLLQKTIDLENSLPNSIIGEMKVNLAQYYKFAELHEDALDKLGEIENPKNYGGRTRGVIYNITGDIALTNKEYPKAMEYFLKVIEDEGLKDNAPGEYLFAIHTIFNNTELRLLIPNNLFKKIKTNVRTLSYNKPRNKYSVQKKYQGVGRNDPCPCKSGKKYKRCCGR